MGRRRKNWNPSPVEEVKVEESVNKEPEIEVTDEANIEVHTDENVSQVPVQPIEESVTEPKVEDKPEVKSKPKVKSKPLNKKKVSSKSDDYLLDQFSQPPMDSFSMFREDLDLM